MSDLISQIQIDEIQAEPTFADWQEFQAWLDSLPADEPLYFPDGEQGLTRKPRPSRGYSSPHYSNRGIFFSELGLTANLAGEPPACHFVMLLMGDGTKKNWHGICYVANRVPQKIWHENYFLKNSFFSLYPVDTTNRQSILETYETQHER